MPGQGALLGSVHSGGLLNHHLVRCVSHGEWSGEVRRATHTQHVAQVGYLVAASAVRGPLVAARWPPESLLLPGPNSNGPDKSTRVCMLLRCVRGPRRCKRVDIKLFVRVTLPSRLLAPSESPYRVGLNGPCIRVTGPAVHRSSESVLALPGVAFCQGEGDQGVALATPVSARLCLGRG